jgi:hypothetical protein
MTLINLRTTEGTRARNEALWRNEYIFIGRPSKWGNPFILGRDGNRETVIARFEAYWYAPEQAQLRADADVELAGKTCGCFCDPLPCHGHVIQAWVLRQRADAAPRT